MSNSNIDFYEKTNINDLVPLVAFLVPEMDLGVIKYFLKLAIIQFARDTRILKREFHIQTYDNTSEYFLEPEDHYSVFRLNEVKLNGCCLDVTIDCDCMSSGCGINSGINNGYYEYKQGKITLCSPTCRTDKLEATAIVIPSLDSCEFDSEISDNWFEAIVEKFKSHIYGGNDVRWKNMTDSRLAIREYRRIVDDAKAEYMVSNVSSKIVRLTR